jgi:hypothetical protein
MMILDCVEMGWEYVGGVFRDAVSVSPYRLKFSFAGDDPFDLKINPKGVLFSWFSSSFFFSRRPLIPILMRKYIHITLWK